MVTQGNTAVGVTFRQGGTMKELRRLMRSFAGSGVLQALKGSSYIELKELKLQVGRLLLEKRGLEARVVALEGQMGRLLALLNQ